LPQGKRHDIGPGSIVRLACQPRKILTRTGKGKRIPGFSSPYERSSISFSSPDQGQESPPRDIAHIEEGSPGSSQAPLKNSRYLLFNDSCCHSCEDVSSFLISRSGQKEQL